MPPQVEEAEVPAATRKRGKRLIAVQGGEESREPARRFPTLAAMTASGSAPVGTDDDAEADDVGGDYAATEAMAESVASSRAETSSAELTAGMRVRAVAPPQAEAGAPAGTKKSRPLTALPFGRAIANASAAAGSVRPQRPRLLRGRPTARGLPPADTLLPAAGIHTAVAVVGALSGAVLLLARQPVGLWPLTLAIVAGIGGWLAASLAARSREGAVLALAATDVGLLVWLLALVGPRISLLFLIPGLALFALHLAGRPRPAGLVVAASVLAYAASAALSFGGLLQPMLTFTDASGAVCDGALACLGLLIFFRQALAVEARRRKAEALTAARSFELSAQRARNQALRQRIEADAERLHDALHNAVRGRPYDAPDADGPLSPLAEEVELAAARLAALQRDRDARRQMESAVRRLTRALERAWLGLPWEWPEPSGTELDEVVALLRSPNPRDTARARLDENSGLLPIPTLDLQHTPQAWVPPQPHPLAPLAEPHPLWSSGELRAVRPFDAGRRAQQSSLPWDEWDDWRTWDAEG